MQFSMTTMTKYHQIAYIIVCSIVIYMMDLNSAFAMYACFTFFTIMQQCFLSISYATVSSVFTFITTIYKCSTFPIKMLKCFFTSFTYASTVFPFIKRKVALLRAKYFIITSNLKYFLAVLTLRMFYTIFVTKIICTRSTTKNSFFSISYKHVSAVLADFIHVIYRGYMNTYLTRNTHLTKEAIYG